MVDINIFLGSQLRRALRVATEFRESETSLAYCGHHWSGTRKLPNWSFVIASLPLSVRARIKKLPVYFDEEKMIIVVIFNSPFGTAQNWLISRLRGTRNSTLKKQKNHFRFLHNSRPGLLINTRSEGSYFAELGLSFQSGRKEKTQRRASKSLHNPSVYDTHFIIYSNIRNWFV